MLLDILTDLFKSFIHLMCILCVLISLPFVVAHVVDGWNAPEYPHTGYTPDCPTWEAPADEVENTLPPTYSLAVDSDL